MQGMMVDPGVLALFAVGFVSVTVAVGIGYLAGIDPIFIALFAGLGGMTSNVIIVIFGDRIRRWYRRRRGHDVDENEEIDQPADNWRSRWSHTVTQKYGAPGLGLFAAPIIGPALSTITGLAFGISRRNLLIWMSIGNITWAVLMTVLVAVGFVAAGQIA